MKNKIMSMIGEKIARMDKLLNKKQNRSEDLAGRELDIHASQLSSKLLIEVSLLISIIDEWE